MNARIINGADKLFIKKHSRLVEGLPKSYLEYADILKKLEGVVMSVSREYGERIVLRYPQEIVKDGKRVMGIDVERDLVELV